MIKWLLRIGYAVSIFLIGSVVVLVALGGGRDVSHAEAEVEINRPALQVFSWLHETPKMKQWLGGYVETIPDDKLGARVGARATEVAERDGQRWEMRSELTAFAPGQRLVIHLTHPAFTDDTEYSLSEQAGVTRLRYHSVAHYNQWLFRLISPLVARSVHSKMEADFAKLKLLVESEAPDHHPTVAPPAEGRGAAFKKCCAPEPTATTPSP